MSQRPKAEQVKQVYDKMQELGITIYDLELYGHVETESEQLNVTPEEAYDKLVDQGLRWWWVDGAAIGHYYQATADYVVDTLGKNGLLT